MTSRLPRRRSPGFSRWWPALALVVLLVVAIFFVRFPGRLELTEGTRQGSAILPDGTPVLFITIDTLRQDHMGFGGYHRETTPFLDRFAAKGVYFSRCFSQSSWTLPSMLTLFSSLSPPVFGIREGVVPVPRDDSVRAKEFPLIKVEVFADAHVTLPEVLREHGYATVGISTNGHLIERQGFAQGFDVFNEVDCMWGTAECALARAIEEIEAGSLDHLFLWVHIFDPHFDEYGTPPTYAPRPGYKEMFRSGSTGSETESVVADYDRKIRYTDDQLAAFFARLEEQGILERFLVIIAADHGEEFNEKGRWGHSKALTNTLINVPLIFRLPGEQAANRVVTEVVRNLDVMPTILDLLGIPAPPGTEGISLRPALEGGRLPPLPVYADTKRMGRNMTCLIDPAQDRKLVVDLKAGSVELYEFSTDFNEAHNLVEQHPAPARDMRQHLHSMVTTMRKRAIRQESREEISDEERERLKGLGYIGG